MPNLQPFKTPIYTGINDAPVAPTSSKGGNGSDLIDRVNKLIDAVETALNASPGVSISDWRVTMPASTDNAKLRIYFLNCTESKVINDSPLWLYFPTLVKTYLVDTDFTPGNELNITELIQANGIGYYFFILETTNNNVKGTTSFWNVNASPKGAIKSFDFSKSVTAFRDESTGDNAFDITPLGITTVEAEVSFNLNDSAPG